MGSEIFRFSNGSIVDISGKMPLVLEGTSWVSAEGNPKVPWKDIKDAVRLTPEEIKCLPISSMGSKVFRFTNGVIVDMSPMAEGKPALALKDGSWVTAGKVLPNLLDIKDAVRLSPEEIKRLPPAS